MELIYGTYNPSKLESMNKMLEGIDIEIISPRTIRDDIIEVDETGNNPLINATLKAKSYYRQFKKPVFSCDSGLYFLDVKEQDQPGVKVRRINSKRLDDQQMISYYTSLVKKYGGKVKAYYKNAICLVIDDNHIIKYDGEDLNSELFCIVDKPHKKIKEGFPLDSLSVDIITGEYYFDLDKEERNDIGVINGFRKFFEEKLLNTR